MKLSSEKLKRRLDHFKPLDKVLDYKVFKLFLNYPFKFLYYLLYKKVVYQRTQKGKVKSVNTFFGKKMNIILPASLDIYFFGLKSHPSEVAFSKFVVLNLKDGDVFIDIGAHFGYYTKLAATLIGKGGKVISIEASPETFKILRLNTINDKNIIARNLVVSDHEMGFIEFCVFPVYYSELNTLNPEQYKNSEWYGKVDHQLVQVETTTLSSLIERENVYPKIIKIDVEGAEEAVIKGSLKKLTELEDVFIAMEFINDGKSQENYVEAEEAFASIGYKPKFINQLGELEKIRGSVLTYMQNKKLVSENIVFTKKEISRS